MGKYSWIDSFCLSFQGAAKDVKEEWRAIRFLIGGKMFVLQGEDNISHPIITLKLAPSRGDYFRSSYKDVIPGYYMNKLHWNSVYLDSNFPEDILKQMIEESYELVFESLAKHVQIKIKNI